MRWNERKLSEIDFEMIAIKATSSYPKQIIETISTSENFHSNPIRFLVTFPSFTLTFFISFAFILSKWIYILIMQGNNKRVAAAAASAEKIDRQCADFSSLLPPIRYELTQLQNLRVQKGTERACKTELLYNCGCWEGFWTEIQTVICNCAAQGLNYIHQWSNQGAKTFELQHAAMLIACLC